jgi:hypothetical protein
MARSPVGVAMGVLGDAHLQVRHPVGQVPSSFGSVQVGRLGPTGPGIVQQIRPASQQVVPQQNWPAMHGIGAVHSGSPQTPSLHA